MQAPNRNELDGAESILRGGLPLLWVAVPLMALFALLVPTDTPEWSYVIEHTQPAMGVGMAAFLLAVLTWMFGLPSRHEIIASIAAEGFIVACIFGMMMFAEDHPLWMFGLLLAIVIPLSRWVFLRASASLRKS